MAGGEAARFLYGKLVSPGGEITPRQVAGWLGMPLSTLYAYLEGARTPPPELFRQIHRVTGDRAYLEWFLVDTAYVLSEKPAGRATREDVRDMQLDAFPRFSDWLESITTAMRDGRLTGEELEAIRRQYDRVVSKMADLDNTLLVVGAGRPAGEARS